MTLEWSIGPVAETPDERMLALRWRETGGPETVAPSGPNGSRTVVALLAAARGELEHEWHPAGLIARVRLPIRGGS